MTTRKGGAIGLGDGRIGVPLSDWPSDSWRRAIRGALMAQRTDDARWQHAADAATVDRVAGNAYLALQSSDLKPVDLVVSYLDAIDAAIGAAGDAVD